MKTALVALLALSACAMNAAEPVAPMGICAAGKASSLIGSKVTDGTGEKVRTLTGAKLVRSIRPGMAVTMDYREDRANIYIDAANRIERISCG